MSILRLKSSDRTTLDYVEEERKKVETEGAVVHQNGLLDLVPALDASNLSEANKESWKAALEVGESGVVDAYTKAESDELYETKEHASQTYLTESSLDGINNTINGIGATVSELEGTMTDLKSDVDIIDEQVRGIDTSLAEAHSSIEGINTTLSGIDGSINDINGEITLIKNEQLLLSNNDSTIQGDIAVLEGKVANLEANGGGGSSDASIEYDLVIRTQEEFDDFCTSVTNNNCTAVNVLFVGDGGTLEFVKADGLSIDLISTNITKISGIKNAIINIQAEGKTSIYGLRAEADVDNITLKITGARLIMGFAKLTSATNLTFIGQSSDTNSGPCIGFQQCNNIINCLADCTSPTSYAHSYSNCTNIVNSKAVISSPASNTNIGSLTSAYYHSINLLNVEAIINENTPNAYGFRNCEHISNYSCTHGDTYLGDTLDCTFISTNTNASNLSEQDIESWKKVLEVGSSSVYEDVELTAWTTVDSADPYKYSATATATAAIGENSVVELINDNAVAFAKYGFAIASISGQEITFYAIDKPTASITLKIKVEG